MKKLLIILLSVIAISCSNLFVNKEVRDVVVTEIKQCYYSQISLITNKELTYNQQLEHINYYSMAAFETNKKYYMIYRDYLFDNFVKQSKIIQDFSLVNKSLLCLLYFIKIKDYSFYNNAIEAKNNIENINIKLKIENYIKSLDAIISGNKQEENKLNSITKEIGQEIIKQIDIAFNIIVEVER